jgi:hypothetical protein
MTTPTLTTLEELEAEAKELCDRVRALNDALKDYQGYGEGTAHRWRAVECAGVAFRHLYSVCADIWMIRRKQEDGE